MEISTRINQPQVSHQHDAGGPQSQVNEANENELPRTATVNETPQTDKANTDQATQNSSPQQQNSGPEQGQNKKEEAQTRFTRSVEEDSKQTLGLSDSELKQLEKLKTRDREVRAHEAAHLAAAGQFATSGATFSYQSGPDGQRYAIGGEVGIDASPVAGDPQATLRKAEQIQRAANAPAEPSAQDNRVAAQARNMANEARVQIQKAETEALQQQSEADNVAEDAFSRAAGPQAGPSDATGENNQSASPTPETGESTDSNTPNNENRSPTTSPSQTPLPEVGTRDRARAFEAIGLIANAQAQTNSRVNISA